MSFGLFILALIVLHLLVGTVPTAGIAEGAAFRSPVFVALLALLALSCVICCVRRMRGWKALGFHMTHLGVVCVLLGGLIGFLRETKTNVALPIAGRHSIRELPTPDRRSTIPLDFGLTVEKFEVEFYDPNYDLYAPEADTESETDYVFKGTFRPAPDGSVDLGEFGRVPADVMKPSGEWIKQHVLPNGWLLDRQEATPRHFGAQMVLTGPGKNVAKRTLAVNRPVSHAGWRFYLMDYDKRHRRYVVLKARRDPGRLFALGGMVAMMIGTALLCFGRKGRRGAA